MRLNATSEKDLLCLTPIKKSDPFLLNDQEHFVLLRKNGNNCEILPSLININEKLTVVLI